MWARIVYGVGWAPGTKWALGRRFVGAWGGQARWFAGTFLWVANMRLAMQAGRGAASQHVTV